MAIKAASLFVEIGANTRGAEAGMKKVDQGVRTLGEVGTGALKVLGGAIIGAGAGFLALGGKALGAYASFERMGSSLSQLVAKEKLNSGAAKDMGSALASSAKEAANLQGWIQKLAIQSPFTSEGVADAFKMSMAYGFTTTQAKRLTTAMIDFAAGSGASEYAMSKIALALGQIRAKGKLAGGEVLQLTEAGLGVNEILAKAFGKTTAQIVDMREKGLIPADQAIEAIVANLEQNFGGAAQRQGSTIAGLTASLEDLQSIGLREFFGPVFREFQPDLEKFVTTLQDPKTLENIRAMGQEFATVTREIVTAGTQAVGWFSGLESGSKGAAIGLGLLALNAGTVVKVVGGTITVTSGLVSMLATSWSAWNAGLSLTTALQAGLGAMPVTLGAIGLAAAAVVGVWIAWNENIEKTNRIGVSGVAAGIGKELDKVANSTRDATKVTEAFVNMYAGVQKGFKGGGIASLFVDQRGTAKASLSQLSSQLSSLNVSYQEYTAQMMRAGEATGMLSGRQAQNILNSGNQARINQFLAQTIGLMTEEQYRNATATQQGAAANSNATNSYYQLSQAQRDAFNAMEGTNASFAQQAQSAQAAQEKVGSLTQAWADVTAAQATFNQGYAGQVVQALQSAGVTGEQYALALGTVDEKLGSNFLAQEKANKELDAAAKKFQQTGDIDAFSAALDTNKTKWAEIDQGIKDATTSWNNLMMKIGEANLTRITIFVDIRTNHGRGSGPSGGGGSDKARADADIAESAYALGGQAQAGHVYSWQEHGEELFIPKTDGYVMNGAQTSKLISLLEQFVSGGGSQRLAAAPAQSAPIFNIFESQDARRSALEIARLQRR